MFARTLILLIAISCTLYSSSSVRARDEISLLSSTTACETNPFQCIRDVEEALLNTPEHSREWYRLKLLHVNAMWQINKSDIDTSYLSDILNLPDAPPVLRVSAMIIYAKILIIRSELVEGRRYVDEAIGMLNDINQISVSPRRYADILVLLSYLDEDEKAEAFAQLVTPTVARFKRAMDTPEYDTAVGHLEFRLGRFKVAKQHYQSALDANTRASNFLDAGVSCHNLARTFQALNDHQQAVAYFQKAIAHQGTEGKSKNLSYTRLRMIESMLALNLHDQAKQEYDSIRSEDVLTYARELYADVGLRLSKP